MVKVAEFKFDQGDSVKDRVTDFVGVIVGRCEWAFGNPTYAVQARELKDQAPLGFVYFDENRLEFTPKVPSLGFCEKT